MAIARLVLGFMGYLAMQSMVVEQYPLEGQFNDPKRQIWEGWKQLALNYIEINTSLSLCCDV